MSVLRFSVCLLLFCLGETKICDVDYYQNAIAVIGYKNEFEYYPWHNFLNTETDIKFLHIKRDDVKHICKSSLPVGLDEVVLVDVELEYIEPGLFEKSPVQHVVIQGNNLTTITNGVFNGTGIKSLVLNNNNIEKIESYAFEEMHSLEVIALDGNRIQVWDPDWFRNAQILHEVSFADNLLEVLPEHTTKYVVNNFEEYSTYILDGNLNFDNNKIKHIHPLAFENLQYFGTISLSNNNLLLLPGGVFKGFKYLFGLYMNTNNFICFSDKTVESFKGVKRLFLGRNKMNKNCVDQLRDYFVEKSDLLFL